VKYFRKYKLVHYHIDVVVVYSICSS